MMHRAWSSIVEVPYCFSRSSVKFQGHTALKIVEFDPNWAFPDCNSSLNSPMAMKCYTQLETAKERCPIVFRGHPSNFKVTRYKTSPILTQIGRFRTIGQSQLSNLWDLPCLSYIHIYSRMKRSMLWLYFSKVCSQGSKWQWGNNDLDNDFVANIQVITWTNDLDDWCYMSSVSFKIADAWYLMLISRMIALKEITI